MATCSTWSTSLVLVASVAFSACAADGGLCPAARDGHRLAAIGVFDGPIQELAQLVPDSSDGPRGRAISRWQLGYIYDAGRRVVIACTYAGLPQPDSVELARRVEGCVYAEAGAGHPPGITCR